MIKLILTLFNIIIFFESIYAQIDTFSIHKKYSDNGLILFSDDFSDNLTVNFNRTDTLNGYEIKYYYFINQDFQRCIYDLFFVNAEILKYKNLYSLFSNEIVSYQLDGGMLSPSDFLVEGDTFIYEKNTIEYEKNIFPEIWNISDMLYKISDYEYCEFFKVQVIVDVYTGDSKSLKLFNPIFMLNKKQCSNEIFYKYRKVLTRESFDEPVIWGVKREKYFKNKKCIYSD